MGGLGMFQNIVDHLLEHSKKEYRSLILKLILIALHRETNLEETGALEAVQIEAHGFDEADLGDTVCVHTFCEVAHVKNDLVEHLTAILNAFVCLVVFFQGEYAKGEFYHRKDLTYIVVEFLGDGLKSGFLYFELGAEKFLLILVFHAGQLLFLAVLPALIKKEHRDDEADHQEGQSNGYYNYHIDFLVLSLHKNAMVNDKYKKIFNITNIARNFIRRPC